MTAQEMMVRSEIRQILNEAGINRETIKQMVKDTITDVVKAQVNQVLMERKEKDLKEVVIDYLNSKLWDIIHRTTDEVVKQKMRWLDFSVKVDVTDKSKKEADE